MNLQKSTKSRKSTYKIRKPCFVDFLCSEKMKGATTTNNIITTVDTRTILTNTPPILSIGHNDTYSSMSRIAFCITLARRVF